jgi:hypothetical protein
MGFIMMMVCWNKTIHTYERGSKVLKEEYEREKNILVFVRAV